MNNQFLMMNRQKFKSVKDVLQVIEQRAPQGCAEEWDNVGLLAGDPNWKTHGAVVCVDLTEEAIRLAEKRGYRLIVNHHPCIFPKGKGLSQILPQDLVFTALQKGIAVAACHTNFDQCAIEVIDLLAQGLGLQVRGRLIEKPSRVLKKCVVYVPLSHLTQVRGALLEAGAGQVGQYDLCSFYSEGEGTFRGKEGCQPYLGEVGEFESVKEARLEVVFPKGLQAQILKALKSSHPYEEVAYDLYSLDQRSSSLGVVRGLGYGFWGEFKKPKPFSDVARGVRNLFGINGFWMTHPAPKKVLRIGFVAGKGASFLEAAAAAQCDLFITGEAGYHSVLMGARKGVSVMELGHRESERFFLHVMGNWLSAEGLKVAEVHTPTQQIWSGGTK